MSSVAYPNPQALFYQQYESIRRDEVVGILLALFLGTFGAHHFYLRRTGLGVLYCCFFWTGITTVLGIIECFFMPARVREFNAIQAAAIAAALGLHVPPGWGWPAQVNISASAAAAVPPGVAPPAETLIPCRNCRYTNVVGSRFCAACGSIL